MRLLYKLLIIHCLVIIAITPRLSYSGVENNTINLKHTEKKIPFKREGKSVGTLVLRTSVVLIFVLIFAFLALYVLRRYFPSLGFKVTSKNQHIRIIEMQRLNPRVSLYLVNIEKETLLLIQSGDRVDHIPVSFIQEKIETDA